MKKLKNETGLLKEAIRVGESYVIQRKAGPLEKTDSEKDKVAFIYRLLVHDRLIQPLAKNQVNVKAMKKKLALWIARHLPESHPLLK